MKDLGKEVERESSSGGIFSGNEYVDHATVSVPSVCNTGLSCMSPFVY